MSHVPVDELIAIARGETAPTPDLADHLGSCPDCRRELESHRDVIALVGEAAMLRETDFTVPERVWHATSAALTTSHAAPSPERAPRQLPFWRQRRVLAAAALAAVVAVGATIGIQQLVRDSGGTTVRARVALKPLPGSAATHQGSGTVVESGGRQELDITSRGLPAPTGFYEVWLLDPVSGKMVPMGDLGDTGSGSFPMPPGLDTSRYTTVDISAELYDGNPAHSSKSVLRGQLRS